MKAKLIQKRTGLFFICLTLFFCSLYFVLSYLLIPRQLYLLQGKENSLKYNLPFKIDISSEDNEILQVNGSILSKYNLNLNETVRVKSDKSGIVDLKLKIFGILPASMQVKILPDVKLYPGGQLVGVKLETEGVIVVGLQELEAMDGTMYNPGKDSELMLGDIVYKINDQEVNTAEEVRSIINNLSGEKVKLNIYRNGSKKTIRITPVKCKSDEKYRLGLWVRDNTAGIGTVTFIEEKSNIFGALGHPITDITTNVVVPVKDGSIVSSKVVSILPGKSGVPGEIRGVFYNEDKILGNLTKNTENGIFGVLSTALENEIYDKPLSIGLQSDIKEGSAQILTTLEEDKIEAFDIVIEKVNRQSKKSGKGMVIRITDEKLLEQTGGIIQGMSGSPIIQEGKLIGAVTHVFVKDPTKGYGIFIEWMFEEAQIAFVE